MKSLFLYLAMVGSQISCNESNDAETELAGQYKLAEILADPGDGSGTFQSVNSDKVIEFHKDGTVSSNGDLCTMAIQANASTTGTYSLADSTISSSNCDRLKFGVNGNQLMIHYPCIEPCIAKFIKQ